MAPKIYSFLNIRYKNILNEAIESSSHKPLKCIIFQRKNIDVAELDKDTDVLWEDALDNAKPHPCVPVEANEPLYVLYTSGTTGNHFSCCCETAKMICNSV